MLANRITRVTVRNYRSLGDVTVDLDDLTVLVGPNGSGKSNFLDALRFVRDAILYGIGEASDARGGMPRLRHWSAGEVIDDMEIQLDMVINGQDSTYGFVLGTGTGRRQDFTVFKREELHFGEKWYRREHIEVEHNLGQLIWKLGEPTDLILSMVSLGVMPILRPVYDFLTQTQFYVIDPSKLRESQPVTSEIELSEHGGNFAAALDQILNGENPWKTDLLECLARIVPGLDLQNAVTVRADADFGEYLVNVNYLNGNKFRQTQESDGTLRALGILTAIYQHPTPPVIGFEEPELYIHPAALAVLKDVFAEAAAKRSQVILTTHSPDLISLFPASSLRVVERVEGATQIGPIRADQLDVINDQLFGGGDLLRIEGLDRE